MFRCGLFHLYKISSSFLTANVILLLWCLEGQKLFGNPEVTLQDGLLHTGLPCPLDLILVHETCTIKSAAALSYIVDTVRNTTHGMKKAMNRLLYPYPLQPVDLVVEQHLSVWQVDVAVVGVVEKVSK